MNVKRICILLFAVTALAVLTSGFASAGSRKDAVSEAAAASGASTLAGDVDRNGKVNAADARQALRFAVGLDTHLRQFYADADYDGDGKVTAGDARLILRRALGLDGTTAPQPDDGALDAAIAAALNEQYRSDVPDGLLHIQSYVLLAKETAQDTTTVYLIVYHTIYRMNEGPARLNGEFTPAAITFSVTKDGIYSMTAFWTPEDGADHERDIRAKFPGAAAEEALNIGKYAAALENDNRNQLAAYLDRIYEQSGS